MTSVYATSPSSAFPIHGNSAGSPSAGSSSSAAAAAAAAARYISSSSPRMIRRSSSGIASPRKGAAAVAPSSNNLNVIPPLHLPRGHDSSDVAASLDESLYYSQSLKGVMESPAFAMLQQDALVKTDDHDMPPIALADVEEDEPTGPFEGPEKLLELWFADSKDDVVDRGLMRVDRQVWENMLDIVRCKVLSVIRGNDVDAYLLSESSMFVFPHKLILKTCGTTTLLLGLQRILSIAHDTLKAADDPTPSEALVSLDLGKVVKQCFYSRKSFMFPERQKGPHRDWMLEVGLLEEYFSHGSAYTVGKMNGNHWLLYMTSPSQQQDSAIRVARPLRLPSLPRPPTPNDETLEILMTHLSPTSCARFEFPSTIATPSPADVPGCVEHDRGHLLGARLSSTLGLTELFPTSIIDGYAFEPCGFSANALVTRPPTSPCEDGYWTVHVTPEQDSSYASFETNMSTCSDGQGLPWLIARVLSIFEPGRLSVTLFTSSPSSSSEDEAQEKQVVDEDGLVSLCPKQDHGDILHALQLKNYRRTDRIAYEFEDYDFVFVSFDKIGLDLPHA